jgi:hypothetical protein
MNEVTTKVQLICDRFHLRDGVPVRRDEPFETDEGDAADLVAMNYAHRAPAVAVPYARRDMQAAQSATVTPDTAVVRAVGEDSKPPDEDGHPFEREIADHAERRRRNAGNYRGKQSQS